MLGCAKGKVLKDFKKCDQTVSICVCKPVLIEVKLLSSHRDKETGALSFLMSTFQKNGSLVLEKAIPGLQTIHLCVKETERIYNFVFSKVNCQ